MVKQLLDHFNIFFYQMTHISFNNQKLLIAFLIIT
jgi:hypothetical protein